MTYGKEVRDRSFHFRATSAAIRGGVTWNYGDVPERK